MNNIDSSSKLSQFNNYCEAAFPNATPVTKNFLLPVMGGIAASRLFIMSGAAIFPHEFVHFTATKLIGTPNQPQIHLYTSFKSFEKTFNCKSLNLIIKTIYAKNKSGGGFVYHPPSFNRLGNRLGPNFCLAWIFLSAPFFDAVLYNSLFAKSFCHLLQSPFKSDKNDNNRFRFALSSLTFSSQLLASNLINYGIAQGLLIKISLQKSYPIILSMLYRPSQLFSSFV